LRGFHYKRHFQRAFDDNLSATHVFIKQIFRAIKVASPSPIPPQGCAGVGKKWLFSATSRGFGYGYEAVRIRVKFKL
jgi:hypothetical protein